MNQTPDQTPRGDTPPERGPRRTRRSGTRAATRRMVTCAVLCALSVVVLSIGMLIEIIDLTAAALAAVIILLVYLCYGPRYALLSYAVTGVLGVLLMPKSLAVWAYIGLVGYYPVIKGRLERLPRLIGWFLKLLLFAVVMGGCMIIAYFVFGGQGSIPDAFLKLFEEESGKTGMVWAILGLSLFTFVIFDILLDRLLILYNFRFKRKIDKWMKP